MKKTIIRLLLFVAAMLPAALFAQTGCDITLPWSENFDSYTTTGGSTMPTCWNRVAPFQATSSSAVVPNLTTAYGHGTVLNFMGQGGSNDGTGTMKIATPLIPAPLNGLELSFAVYKSGLTVYLATNPSDESTYTLVGSYSPGWVWTTYEVRTDTLTGAPSAQGYLVFCGTYGTSGYSTAYLDDLTVSVLNSCDRPLTVNVELVGTTTATLSWTAVEGVTSYRVSYDTVNDIADAATQNVGTTDIQLTDLEPGSTYYVWVQSLCDNGVSDPRSTTFTTELSCYPIVNLQLLSAIGDAASFQWEFDSRGNIADGVWVILRDLTDSTVSDIEEYSIGATYQFFTNLDPTHEYLAIFRTLCNNDTASEVSMPIVFRNCGETEVSTAVNDKSSDFPLNFVYNYSYSQMLYPAGIFFGMDSIIGIVVHRDTASMGVAGARTLSIWMGNSTLAANTSSVSVAGMTHVASGSHGFPAQEWDTVLFSTPFLYNGSSNVRVVIVDSTGMASGSFSACPRWRYHDADWSTYYDFNDNNAYNPSSLNTTRNLQKLADMHFLGQCNNDNSCVAPVAAMTSVDTTHAEIEWFGGVGNVWVVEYRTLGSTVWMVADTVMSTTYLLSGLNPSTRYEARVGVLCDMQTLYSGVVEFTTECTLMHLPFHFTQNDMVAAYMAGFTDCWNWSQYFFRTRLSLSHRGTVYNAGNGEWFMLPAIAEPLQGARLRTWASSSDHGYIKVGIASESNCSDVVWVDTIEVMAGNPNEDHVEYIAYLDSYTGTGDRVVVSPIVNNNYHYIYFFDFHVEPIEGCRPAVGLALNSADAQSLTFHWTPVGAASSWAVYVNGTQVGTATGTPSYTATGLTAYTDYEVSVRGLCDDGDTSDAVTAVFRTGCEGEQCTFTVNGVASSGEGWKGGFLEIVADSTIVVGTVKMLNGSTTVQNFSVCADMELTFNWYSGNADEECSFSITNANGHVLYSTSEATYIGQAFYVTDTICGGGETPYPPVPVNYTVTVNYDATRGTVTGAGTFPEGTAVTLTATSNPGYHFAGWSNGTTDSVYNFLLVSDVTLTADFQENSNQNPEGIEEVADVALTLTPNPASYRVTLTGFDGRATVSIIDLNGREVYRQEAVAEGETIDLAKMAKGVYFVRMVNATSHAVAKLVVR